LAVRRKSFKAYAARRLALTLPVIFFVLILNFFIIHMAPGDPVYMYIGTGRISPEYLDMMRHVYGLDRPLPEQLLLQIIRVFQGNLGFSLWYKTPVTDLILSRIPATLVLMSTALIYATLIGVVMGALSAKKYGSLTDKVLTSFALLGYSMPTFWLAQVLVLVFSFYVGWFPSGGMITMGAGYTGFRYMVDVAWHLVLPAFCLGSFYLALICRTTRGNLLDALSKDYIRTAKAKGLSEWQVLKHGLRNSLLPLATVLGLNLAFFFAGAVVVETVYSWPGMGRLIYDALWARDYPLLLGSFFITSVMVVSVNFITDLLYGYLDPRVRLY